MRIAIVDDEALARDRLRRLLGEIGGIEVVGEAANGRQALELCAERRPDVVLLDIRMPGIDGLETATHLAAVEQAPAVIFTTAYGDHALAAFEANAIDYLLKPVRRERLQQALAKARGLQRTQIDAARRLDPAAVRSHICARHGNQLRLIAINEIVYFRADHKYVVVRHAGGEVLIEESLKSIEEEFAGHFLRIHRNSLVAQSRITALERSPDGIWHVRLADVPERLEISRRHVGPLRDMLRLRA